MCYNAVGPFRPPRRGLIISRITRHVNTVFVRVNQIRTGDDYGTPRRVSDKTIGSAERRSHHTLVSSLFGRRVGRAKCFRRFVFVARRTRRRHDGGRIVCAFAISLRGTVRNHTFDGRARV